jgi:PadR family transcriptional regulator PadR
MRETPSEMLHGTLDVLILRTLLRGPCHGWGISRRIREASRQVLQVNQGSLYPALYRLERRGWIVSQNGSSDEGRPVRIYRLTPAGRRQLVAGTGEWRTFSLAVNWVLETP